MVTNFFTNTYLKSYQAVMNSSKPKAIESSKPEESTYVSFPSLEGFINNVDNFNDKKYIPIKNNNINRTITYENSVSSSVDSISKSSVFSKKSYSTLGTNYGSMSNHSSLNNSYISSPNKWNSLKSYIQSGLKKSKKASLGELNTAFREVQAGTPEDQVATKYPEYKKHLARKIKNELNKDSKFSDAILTDTGFKDFWKDEELKLPFEEIKQGKLRSEVAKKYPIYAEYRDEQIKKAYDEIENDVPIEDVKKKYPEYAEQVRELDKKLGINVEPEKKKRFFFF